MPPFHENTTLDPEAEALAFVRRVEAESTDEDMAIGMLMQAQEVLRWREQVARKRLIEAQTARTLDSRRDLLKSKVKGIKAAEVPKAEGVVKLAPANAIPTKELPRGA